MIRRVLNFVTTAHQQAQCDQRKRQLELAGRIDWEPVAVIVTVALALTWRHYYHSAPSIYQIVAAAAPRSMGSELLRWADAPENRELARLANWVVAQTVSFLLAPLLCCLVLWRNPANYGLKLRGMTAGWRFYLPMYFLMLPILYFVSHTTSFQASYPFYDLQDGEHFWPRFAAWELLYAWQFIALEFFFRGFMVQGLRRSCGGYAVLVMTIPYCMIHFGKPPLETLASIAAGLAMGIMSLGTRSIWMGAALHIAIAWTMDILALRATGRL